MQKLKQGSVKVKKVEGVTLSKFKHHLDVCTDTESVALKMDFLSKSSTGTIYGYCL